MWEFARFLCRWLILGPLVASLAPSVEAGPRTLEPGSRVERSLAPGEIHRYGIFLLSGQFFRVVVEPNHLDATVRVLSAVGRVLRRVENAADRREPLSISTVTSQPGTLLVEIRLRRRTSASGRYVLVVERPRPALADDEKRIAAERLRGDADQLLARGASESSKVAIERYERALATFREIGDRGEEAATLDRMSDALSGLGDVRQGLELAKQALALWRAEGDRQGEAAGLDQVGLAQEALGDQRRALESLDQALALRRASADLGGQAETLNDIASVHSDLGQFPEAVTLYTDALTLARAARDRFAEAVILSNRAGDWAALGETDRALADFHDALAFFRAIGHRHHEGHTQYEIGNVYLRRGEAPAALRRYALARARLHEAGDTCDEAETLNQMGLARLAVHTPRRALPDFELALKLLRACQDRRGEAMVLANSGRAHLDMGETAEGLKLLRRALPLVQASEARTNEAIALEDLARGERAQGDLDAARARVEEALRITESLRESIPAAGVRASFTAGTRDRYDLLIGILMDLHAKQPSEGWDAEALHASERAKARSLVELLAESRIDLREGADETLLEQERSLEARIQRLRREEQRRLAAPSGPEPSGSSRRALDEILAEYEDAQGRLRAVSPRYAALARPQPLTLKEIQEQVLDRDTLLLEYALGEKRSYVWAVTTDTLTSQALPCRSIVEAAARRLYEAWSVGHGVDGQDVSRRARALGEMLLGPVADQLGNRRLVIVAEGALQFVPFAALPLPGRSMRAPLVSRHEVVALPSATTLAVLRREASLRSPPERQVAVLADPVFDRQDPRVPGGSAPAAPPEAPFMANDDLTRSMQESGLRRLERLTSSRREAEEIAALAGRRNSLEALDFQASRETALGAEVAGARIVHFASHGLLNGRHPELSGIVLSLVDERGRPKDGFLQTRDIYKMRLSADLVVLSACQTALGREIRGEGLVGLVRGFMYAGAPRVVASLWRVPDRATAELMKRLYRSLLLQNASPSEALRAAQESMRTERRWSAPFDWAGFVLQGDWR